jgi:hypothetical protein
MANIPVPVFKINGANALVTFLYVAVIFGSLHLLAISKPDNKVSKAWLALGF